jgi:hypothetical protein
MGVLTVLISGNGLILCHMSGVEIASRYNISEKLERDECCITI